MSIDVSQLILGKIFFFSQLLPNKNDVRNTNYMRVILLVFHSLCLKLIFICTNGIRKQKYFRKYSQE